MKSKWWLIGLIVCLALASLAPLASTSPDGLEKVAQDKGFGGLVQQAPFQIIAGYIFPGVQNVTLANVMGGLIGTLILFAVVYALSWALVYRRRGKNSEA